jgi:hypothetical protein
MFVQILALQVVKFTPKPVNFQQQVSALHCVVERPQATLVRTCYMQPYIKQ